MPSNTASSSSAPAGSADSSASRTKSKRPKYSKFTQQELPACKPILTPGWVILTFLVISVIFIPLGVVSLFASQDVVEIVDRYDNDCVPTPARANKVAYIQGVSDKSCNRTLVVPKKMKQPIYVYYQLENFYQNHRRYVKSRSDSQLRSVKDENQIDACKPEDDVNGRPIVPCGLIAWSLFNDTYALSKNNQPLTVNKRGIAWKSDREHKFGKNVFPKNFQEGNITGGGRLDANKSLSEQEDLIVWMRTAALPTFRKLYGKIREERRREVDETLSVMGQAPSSTAESNGREVDLRLWSVSPLIISGGDSMDSGKNDRDYTLDLPDECLAHVFQYLGAGDRKRCSLVCKRWLFVDGQNRHRLSLDARAEIFSFLTSMFDRFDSVTKLALRCDRKSVSLSDEALVVISVRCLNLSRVKLRGCREITDLGMVEFARNCRNLKKLSVGSCNFGAKGVNAMLEHCKLLEELSVKRLRGIHEAAELIHLPGDGSSSSTLRSICLKELVNGQVFEPLVASTRTLKTLKIIRCLGDWDKVLQMIGEGDSSLSEIHLERLQVSDFGLSAISKCSKLETLHIVKTPECSNFGLIDVAERCKLLRKLHIDGWRTNRIGDEGLVAVARHCLNLQELVLIGVNATHKSLSAIASNCEKLERLALCGSGTIGDTEIACIAKKCGALRKFCIKGCPVSDLGIEALAAGCPNLVKLKVKKCKVVTGEIGEWLREQRRTLVVSMDGDETEATVAVDGESETALEESRVGQAGGGVPEIVGSSNGGGSNNGGSRLATIRSKFGFFTGRNLVSCRFRRWSHNDNGSSST